MTILRRNLSSGFTVLPTATVEDERLSFRARGVLVFLLAKPDNWQVRSDSIAAAGQEGRDAVRKALRELRNYGYYRVVPERQADGTFLQITEVHDTAQEWASEEYSRQVTHRLARKLKRDHEETASADGGDVGGTGDGFSGAGEPAAGASGALGSNQNQHPQKNPPTPNSDVDEELGAALPGSEAGSSCAKHPDGPGRSCRRCGTSPRQVQERQQQAQEQQCKTQEREANARVLAEVRFRPGGETLSEVARQQLARMREAGRDASTRRQEVESSLEIGECT
ncbi:hypothetical protein [Streptomyces sp. YGL11-2]|uniref:hypothetical protein n=1 Tax=Streptomyces sp. YGL11-2 TaxID=3414028 RepID=UPI003CF14D89